MPRPKGRKDSKPRKRRAKKNVVPPARPNTDSPSSPVGVDTPQLTAEQLSNGPAVVLGSSSEFDAAVEKEFGGGNGLPSQGGTCQPSTDNRPPTDEPASPPAASEDVMFGLDAWESVILAPFRSAAIWLGIPALEKLGKARAAMLAKPSYPLYRHYVTQWLTDNPDDELFVSKIMTGAAVATVLQEVWIILKLHRAERQGAALSGTPAKDVQVITETPKPA